MESDLVRKVDRVNDAAWVRIVPIGIIAWLLACAMQLPGRAWLARMCVGEPCIFIAEMVAVVAIGRWAQRKVDRLIASSVDVAGLAVIARRARFRSGRAGPTLLAVSRQLMPMEAEQCAEFVVRYPDVIGRLLGAHDSTAVAAAARALSLGGSPAELARARRQLGRRVAVGGWRDMPDLATAISSADAILAEAAAAAQLAQQSLRAVAVTSAGHDTEMLRPGGLDLGRSDGLLRASAPEPQLAPPLVSLESSIGP
ncbi:MAG: hypothetical protein KGJ62_01230 [Armatimonadetes bacterium]|nr:hypothetical protein [Armatimonadota bacterium]